MKKRKNKKLIILAVMATLCGTSVSVKADDLTNPFVRGYSSVIPKYDIKFGYTSIDDPVRMEGNLKGIYPIFNEDSITMGCVYDGNEKGMEYRWEYCKTGENTWHEISDWSSSEWCTWYPDGNDEYVVVCRLANAGRWVIDGEATWYISRPQMQKKLTGKCAVLTSDGLLFGCTSNVTKNDTDYYTSCYIWSHEKQAWIAQASYQSSDCAWFRVSSLPKGTYMMYTCTEKRMPNGEKRKLSCDYYLFSNNS